VGFPQFASATTAISEGITQTDIHHDFGKKKKTSIKAKPTFE
jgi:hypothetical protein